MKVKFVCRSQDSLEVRIAGNHEELGEWDPHRAAPMTLESTAGHHRWVKNIDIPSGTTVEFKFIKRTGGGFRWERDPNRVYTFGTGQNPYEDDFREP